MKKGATDDLVKALLIQVTSFVCLRSAKEITDKKFMSLFLFGPTLQNHVLITVAFMTSTDQNQS